MRILLEWSGSDRKNRRNSDSILHPDRKRPTIQVRATNRPRPNRFPNATNERHPTPQQSERLLPIVQLRQSTTARTNVHLLDWVQ